MLLEYKIELEASGLVDGPDRSLGCQERLEKLRLWRDAWETLKWTTYTVSTVQVERRWKIRTFGSIYCEVSDNKVSFFQPASKLRGLPTLEWTVDVPVFSGVLAIVEYDRDNQLLVSIAKSLDQ